jgi:hypothetical protein
VRWDEKRRVAPTPAAAVSDAATAAAATAVVVAARRSRVCRYSRALFLRASSERRVCETTRISTRFKKFRKESLESVKVKARGRGVRAGRNLLHAPPPLLAAPHLLQLRGDRIHGVYQARSGGVSE